MMLEELTATLSAVPACRKAGGLRMQRSLKTIASRKQTVANRRHSLQHLRELYALDPAVPLFRVLASVVGD